MKLTPVLATPASEAAAGGAVVQLALSSMVLDVNNALGESFARVPMSVTRLRAFVNAKRRVNAGGRTFKMTSQSQYRLFGRVLRRMHIL